jgi:hypothetical protein
VKNKVSKRVVSGCVRGELTMSNNNNSGCRCGWGYLTGEMTHIPPYPALVVLRITPNITYKRHGRKKGGKEGGRNEMDGVRQRRMYPSRERRGDNEKTTQITHKRKMSFAFVVVVVVVVVIDDDSR